MQEIQILRKDGWILNPNDRQVNSILRMIAKNNGECPCHNTSVDKHCPCSDYKEKDVCHCGLYLKVPEKKNVKHPNCIYVGTPDNIINNIEGD